MKRAYWDVVKEKLIAGWADGSVFEKKSNETTTISSES